jgi:hypothetical protein
MPENIKEYTVNGCTPIVLCNRYIGRVGRKIPRRRLALTIVIKEKFVGVRT